MKIDIVDHVDSLGAIIERTQSIVGAVTTDLLGDWGTRRLTDKAAASLLWQVEENLKAMSREIGEMWEECKADAAGVGSVKVGNQPAGQAQQ